MDFRPEELEPLKMYNFLSNDDNEVLLQLPGCFKGEALIGKFYYNGGRHAVFVRNKYQKILCDEIHPEIRKLLPLNSRILIYESDMMREYYAEIVDEDIDDVAEEAYKLHSYSFDHHMFAVTDQTLDIGDVTCSLCKRQTRLYYQTVYNDKQYKICPDCIENAVPANNGIELYPEMDKNCKKLDLDGTVFMMNPPVLCDGKPIKTWGIHCGQLGIYIGQPEIEDISGDVRRRLEETWDNENNIYKDLSIEEAFEKVDNGESMCCLFRCPECGKIYCIFIKESD
ncbi:MAG: CbrC family protein [Lachnospiraceae bacterium]|nr:CbrC family protein [Lachnospiraceae bacterium]